MFACYLCAKHKPEIQAVETALMYYVVWLRENRGRLNKTGIKASSIRNYVVHVANFFDDVGSSLPNRSKFSRYNRTLAGLENLEDTLALPEFRVFRVTLQFLRKGCFKLLDLSDPDTVMFWTLITSAVTNAFRLKGIGLVRSKPDAVRNPIEVVRVQHLTFKPNMLRPLSSTLFKKRTKTSKNVDISWGYSKNNVINPVKYQRQYLLNRGFTSTDNNTEPLWQWSSGNIATADSVLWVVKGLMLLNNLNPYDYDKISFRHGGAQEVTNQLHHMKAVQKIQRIAHRWSKKSTSWRRYSDIPHDFKVRVTAALADGCPSDLGG